MEMLVWLWYWLKECMRGAWSDLHSLFSLLVLIPGHFFFFLLNGRKHGWREEETGCIR